ncbi:MAG: alpha/beta hydrolase [Chitinophagales bacterium]
MSTIQFSHANGFPAKSYQHFFECFDSDYQFSYVNMFGHGAYKAGRNWQQLTQELIADIEAKHQEPVIGAGHSLGGVLTLFASIQRPELFEIVLILDPPLFSPWVRVGIGIYYYLGLSKYFVPIAKKAKNRRTHFDSREQVYESFRKKSLFKNFDEQCFKDYIQHGFKDSADGNGIELAFSREVEYNNFCSTPYYLSNTKLQRPTYFIHATKHGVLRPKDLQYLKQTFSPPATFIPFEGGHLFPLEAPEKTAQLLQSIISSQ